MRSRHAASCSTKPTPARPAASKAASAPTSSGIGDIQNWTIHTVDFFGGRFYIGNTIGAVARSSDATAAIWEAPVIPGDAINGLGASIKIRAVSGVLFVAGKPLFNPSRVVKYSTDGVTFTDSTINLAFASTAAQFFPATVAGTDYIIINFGSHLAASFDGAAFNAFANPQNFGFMAFDGNRFIARTSLFITDPFGELVLDRLDRRAMCLGERGQFGHRLRVFGGDVEALGGVVLMMVEQGWIAFHRALPDI